MFVRLKRYKNEKRPHLVESYRDKNYPGKVFQREIAYVYKWSKRDIQTLIRLHGQCKKALAVAQNKNEEGWKRDREKGNAAKLLREIEHHKGHATTKAGEKRQKSDRRVRAMPAEPQNHKNHKNHFNTLLNALFKTASELEDIIVWLEADVDHFGPVKSWNAERKQIVLLKVQPVKSLLDKIHSDLIS